MADTENQEPQPVTVLQLNHRVGRRKYPVLTPSGEVQYYILCPPSWALGPKKKPPRHHNKWIAVIYSGNNPKYHTDSRIAGYLKRKKAWWRVIALELGGNVADEIDDMRMDKARKGNKAANRVRKVFCRPPKEFVWERKEMVGDAPGPRRSVEIRRVAHRRHEFEVGEKKYVVKATRKYSKIKMKGFAFSLKLVRKSDNEVVATFEYSSKGAVAKEDKSKGKKLGCLRIFVPEGADGLDTQTIIQALWIVQESEHAKRQLIIDILKEIGEEAGDGGG